MPELSSAAQAVFDTTFPVYDDEILYVAPARKHASMIAAAALRAAADQVVPTFPPPKFAAHYEKGIWDGKDDVRDQLLAIADELESL
jgi:hypothetical protein